MAGRGDGHVQAQHVRGRCPGEVLKAGDDPRWNPGQEDGDEVIARPARGRQVGEDAWIQNRQQSGQLGMLHVLQEVAVSARWDRVPLVLLAHRHDDLVE